MPRKVSVKKVRRLIGKYAQQEGIAEYAPYLAAQIEQESGFQTNLGSPAGARDVAQFMPATAKSYGVTLGDNRIKDDIRGQVKMMSQLIKQTGNIEDALRGYNAGPGAIEASKGYAETNHYVDVVTQNAKKYKAPVQGAPAQPNRQNRESPSGYGAPSFQSTPGVDNTAQRQSLLQGYLAERGKPGALAGLAYGLSNAQDVAPTTTLVPGNLKQSAATKVKGRKMPERALEWAESKVGFTEKGENTGGLASRLNERFGFGEGGGQPWCAMFTSAAVTRGGAPKEARTASVAEVRRKAQAKEGYRGFVNPARAKKGDLILWNDDHIGIVKGVSNGKIQYVAGNESDGVNPGEADFGEVDVVRPAYPRDGRKVRKRR